MLYWICPECGHECSPAIRECPTCTAPPVQSPVAERDVTSQQLLSLAQNFQLAPLEILAVRPARSAGRKPPRLSPVPLPVQLSPAIQAAVLPARAEIALEPAGLAPIGPISFQAACGNAPAIADQPAEALPLHRRSVAFVRSEVPAARYGGMAGDLTPLITQPAARLKATKPHGNGEPKNGSTPLGFQQCGPSFVSCRLILTGGPLAELEQAAIEAIHASFREIPALSLLPAPAEMVDVPAPPTAQWMRLQKPRFAAIAPENTRHAAIHATDTWLFEISVPALVAPGEITTAPAPPTAQWIRSQKPRFTAIAPENNRHAAVMAGPQAPPLAGPSLPPQLLNFYNSDPRLNRKRTAGWPINLLIAVIIILGAISAFQYMTQDRDIKAASAPRSAQGGKASPTSRVRIVEEHPAARSVEVAGVRIVTGANKRPQLQYIVINHSPSELTGLNIRIAVRSVEALSGTPLFSVSSVVASLGPNQSKEIRTDLDPSVQPSALPDWQSLRTEILVARQ